MVSSRSIFELLGSCETSHRLLKAGCTFSSYTSLCALESNITAMKGCCDFADALLLPLKEPPHCQSDYIYDKFKTTTTPDPAIPLDMPLTRSTLRTSVTATFKAPSTP